MLSYVLQYRDTGTIRFIKTGTPEAYYGIRVLTLLFELKDGGHAEGNIFEYNVISAP